MARRRNALFHRFSRMRGLPPEEKALMQRIADLMDVALNNRQASNPFEPRRNKPSRVIYPPTGLTADTGIKAVKLTWIAPPSDEHLRYEIQVRSVDRGTTETKSSFTNNLTYYGRGGVYEATVLSVGRNGASSTLEKISFDLGSDIMQLEGAKLGATELGTLVQDDVLHLSGYKIFVWGAVVIDEYIAGSGNPDIVFKLWRKEGDDATFTSGGAYSLDLLETITLYPATEDASNLSADALGGQEGYTRFPVPESLGGVRPGSFGTAQSVMFSPIPVSADQVDKRFTYFLQAINRETQTDEVSLSITIWAGAEGAAEAQPGDPYVGPTPYVFPHYNSFHTFNHYDPLGPGTPFFWDSRWAVSRVLDGYALTGNSWTLAIWYRPEGLYPDAQLDDSDNYPGTCTVYQRDSLITENPYDDSRNQIRFIIHTRLRNHNQEWLGQYPNNNWVHQMNVYIGSRYGIDANDYGEDLGVVFHAVALVMDDTEGKSALFPWSSREGYEAFWQNNGWYFTSLNFVGSLNPDPDGPPKLRVWHNCGVNTDPEDEFTAPPPFFHKNGMRQLQYLIEDPNNEYWSDPVDARIGPMYLSNGGLLHTRLVVQDDKGDRMQGFGTAIIHTHSQGIYDGNAENVGAYPTRFFQAGFWSKAQDSWSEYFDVELQGYVTHVGNDMINYLYNDGYGAGVNWREDSTLLSDDVQYYPLATNLTSFWQFGAVETSFYLHEALRDTGYYVYGGDSNMTSEIFPHAEGQEGQAPGDPELGPESWGNTAGIWDIFSPHGSNGTTYSPTAYPGQQLRPF